MDITQRIDLEPESKQKRSAWYLLTGFIIGILIGLLYAWIINPIAYQDTDPASLNEADQDAYRKTIAQVYLVTGNLSNASQRLALLNEANPVYTLGQQAQRELGAGYEAEARALAFLASALQNPAPSQTPLPGSTESIAIPTIIGVPTQTLPALTPVP